MPVKAGRHSDSRKQGTGEDEPRRAKSPSEPQVSVGLDHHRFPDAFVLVLFSFFPLCHILGWVVCWSAALSLFGSHVCFGSDHLIAVLAALWEVSGGEISQLLTPSGSSLQRHLQVTAAGELYHTWRTKPRSRCCASHVIQHASVL